MPTFNFEFEDLPLVIEGGYEAGLVAGFAEVSYSRSDAYDWTIVDIALDGHRASSLYEAILEAEGGATASPRRKPVYLDSTSPIHGMIYHRLENEWQKKVQRAVDDQIAEDREAESDNVADYRRAHRYQAAE